MPDDFVLAESPEYIAECPECQLRTRQTCTQYGKKVKTRTEITRQVVFCVDGKHAMEWGPKGPNKNMKDYRGVIFSEKTPESKTSTWREDLDERRRADWHFYDENWKDVRGDKRQRKTRKGYNFHVGDVRINPANPSPAAREGDEEDKS